MARRKKKKLNKLFLLFIAVVFVLIYHYYDRIEAQYSFIDNKIERYNRDDWGKWADDDNDGLNTRNEVLLEESLIKPLISNNKIVSGRWYDKYTGKYFDDPKDLDIDHLVPLKNAYMSGASNWSKEKKNRYYNYLKNEHHLIAVSRSANRSKGDKSPIEWLPENEEYQCEYIRQWYKIKTDWGLTIEKGFDELSNRVCKGK